MTIPKTMRAMVLTGHGDLSKLEFHEEWPTPTVQDHEVLIKIGACGLNNTDVNTRTAWYSKGVYDATTGEAFQDADDEDGTWGGAAVTFPRIQGADAVGRVVALGNNAPSSLLGERVMIDTWLRDWSDPDNYDKCGYFGSECDGGYAEYVSVSSRQVHSVKSDLTDTELATFATSYITAENMLNRANVAAGDTVLISGASGGVGSALIQLANRRGGQTVAMASETKHEELREYKPTVLLNRSPENLAQCLTESIGKPTVSVVADVVGGDYWSELINVLQRKGRYTCAGAIAGPMVNMDLRTFYLRDLTFTGATIVPPGIFADLVGYIERGEVKPMLAKTYPLKNLREAQTAFIEKSHVGNIVVEI